MINSRRAPRSLLVFVLLLFVQAAYSQKGALDVTYSVSVKDIPNQHFHVTTDIRNINQPRLELSLPTWTPGWYVVENYAKNLLRFEVTDGNGKRLQPRMTRAIWSGNASPYSIDEVSMKTLSSP